MKITKDSNVHEVLEKHPETLPVFTRQGHCFGLLANPVLRSTMAKLVTIEQACKLHFIDIEKLLREINEVVKER
jgi:hypothetical protein